MLVDNFDKVKNVVEWNPNQSYYKFVALIRAKDYKDGTKPVLMDKEKQECFVRQWLVDSQEKFDSVKQDMKTVTEMFKCRLYMTLDRKSTMKSLVMTRDIVLRQLDNFLTSDKPQVSVKMFNKLIPSVTQLAESSDRGFRRWMFDVDTKNQSVVNVLKRTVCREHYLETFETKNGFHVVAKKEMDAHKLLQQATEQVLKDRDYSLGDELLKKVEVKANSLVLVAMGD